MEGDSTRESLAPKGIHRRIFLDPNPNKVVENLERILRRSNNKANKGSFHLQNCLSLPTKSVESIENIILDKETNQSLLRSKYTFELSQVTVGLEGLNFPSSSQQLSHPSSTSLFPQNKSTQSVHIPVTYSPDFVVPIDPIHLVVIPNPPTIMDSRFTPLVLPTQ